MSFRMLDSGASALSDNNSQPTAKKSQAATNDSTAAGRSRGSNVSTIPNPAAGLNQLPEEILCQILAPLLPLKWYSLSTLTALSETSSYLRTFLMQDDTLWHRALLGRAMGRPLHTIPGYAGFAEHDEGLRKALDVVRGGGSAKSAMGSVGGAAVAAGLMGLTGSAVRIGNAPTTIKRLADGQGGDRGDFSGEPAYLILDEIPPRNGTTSEDGKDPSSALTASNGGKLSKSQKKKQRERAKKSSSSSLGKTELEPEADVAEGEVDPISTLPEPKPSSFTVPTKDNAPASRDGSFQPGKIIANKLHVTEADLDAVLTELGVVGATEEFIKAAASYTAPSPDLSGTEEERAERARRDKEKNDVVVEQIRVAFAGLHARQRKAAGIEDEESGVGEDGAGGFQTFSLLTTHARPTVPVGETVAESTSPVVVQEPGAAPVPASPVPALAVISPPAPAATTAPEPAAIPPAPPPSSAAPTIATAAAASGRQLPLRTLPPLTFRDLAMRIHAHELRCVNCKVADSKLSHYYMTDAELRDAEKMGVNCNVVEAMSRICGGGSDGIANGNGTQGGKRMWGEGNFVPARLDRVLDPKEAYGKTVRTAKFFVGYDFFGFCQHTLAIRIKNKSEPLTQPALARIEVIVFVPARATITISHVGVQLPAQEVVRVGQFVVENWGGVTLGDFQVAFERWVNEPMTAEENKLYETRCSNGHLKGKLHTRVAFIPSTYSRFRTDETQRLYEIGDIRPLGNRVERGRAAILLGDRSATR